VSIPGRPVLIGQSPSARPFHHTFMWWVAVLATTTSELPIRKCWLRLARPNTPGAACTPARWAVTCTLVCAGQYCSGRNQTLLLFIQYQAPVTGLLAVICSDRSTAVLSVTGRLNEIMIGMPMP
jgi:hypothetical protein